MKQLFIWIFISGALLTGCSATKDTTPPPVKKNKILTGVQIDSMAVVTFPRYAKSGESWDAYAPFKENPDPYIRIEWNQTELYKSETFDESVWPDPLTFTLNMPLDLKPFDQSLILEMLDEDGISADDNMGYLQFTPTAFPKKSPAELKSADGTFVVRIYYTLIYE
ncbi:MAG: hypothetical protein JNM00_14865 [Flavobacteriales bacterium]|nr:hypothetical protein [Flavobacteriales bacterium]